MKRYTYTKLAGSLSALALGLAAVSMPASAAVSSVADSKHNLGSGGTHNHVTETDQICVFCHTPHSTNPSADVPLWNKGLPAVTYTPYQTNSTTLTGKVLAVGSVSLACLSCHDGSQAMDNMINAPGSGGLAASTAGSSAGYTWNEFATLLNTAEAGAAFQIGFNNDLSDDHPIGIEYCGGGISGTTGTAGCKDPLIYAPTHANTNGKDQWWVDTTSTPTSKDAADFTLFNRTFTAGVGPSVECATCHDPHNPANGTFLRVSNSGSGLCLTCHNK